MQLSLNFVKQYVKLPEVTPKDVALALTLSTVEVEEVLDQQSTLDHVVVGRVIDAVKHPQADRLWVCRVDVKTQQLQIICGGTNVVKGMYVAVAKVGSTVRWHGEGKPIMLEKAKIRGIESNGMIASSVELGLEQLFPAASEREILDLSPYEVRVGDPLAKALGLTDSIFVIDNKSMTNRPDLWGQYGLAREIAALYQTKLKPLKPAVLPELAGPAMPLTVEIEDSNLCPRYAAIVLDNVSLTPSPWWLRRDLAEAGINSINAVVDITNYVMLVLGQPLHAFDYEQLADQKIVVGRAGARINYSALNGKIYDLPAETLMIRDGKKPVAIAGIIGGTNSHVTQKTKTIVLEVANFDASSIRRTEMALGLRTEASSRFEKKLDPELVPLALAYAVELFHELVPGIQVASRIVDMNHAVSQTPVITVPKAFLDSRLGKALDPKEVISILKRLEFVASFKRGVYTISVPSFRGKDVLQPEDVVEEVARIHGYNNIEPRLPLIMMSQPERNLQSRVERSVKGILTRSFGYSEIYTYSFEEPKWSKAMELTHHHVAVANALTPDQMYLRTSLLPGLLTKVVENLRWYPGFKLFELGRVFLKTPGEYPTDDSGGAFLPSQPVQLSGIAVEKADDKELFFRRIKGELEELLLRFNIAPEYKAANVPFSHECLELKAHNTSIGLLGMLKPELAADDLKGKELVFWQLDFGKLVKFADFSRTYAPLPKFPNIVRDIAIVVDVAVRWEGIEDSLRHISPLIRRIELFDVFTSPKLGENKKSLAFRMTFASEERTLESGEVDAIIGKITKTLQESFGAQIR